MGGLCLPANGPSKGISIKTALLKMQDFWMPGYKHYARTEKCKQYTDVVKKKAAEIEKNLTGLKMAGVKPTNT